MTSLEVRPVQPADGPDAARILAHSFERLYNAALGCRPPRSTAVLTALLQQGVMPLEHAWIAVVDGSPAGILVARLGESRPASWCAWWRAVRSALPLGRAVRAAVGGWAVQRLLNRRSRRLPGAHVELLAVDEAHRRRGVARALLARAFRAAAESGHHEVTLHVLESNTAARRLYESEGFALLAPAGGLAGEIARRLGLPVPRAMVRKAAQD